MTSSDKSPPSGGRKHQRLRYLAPNLVTAFNMSLGIISMGLAVRGEFVQAAWLIVYASFLDRVDGFVARLVHGTSEFGVQFDSFADLINFGLAPAVLAYIALGSSPELPFGHGSGHAVLAVACALWVIASTYRLARYNITTEDKPSLSGLQIYFGVPTTLAGGILAIWFLALYKYAPSGDVFPHLVEPFGGAHLIPGFVTPDAVWRYFPVGMFIGAYLMISPLPMPKGFPWRARFGLVLLAIGAITGVLCGIMQIFPEYMMWMPTSWVVVFLIWGRVSPDARGVSRSPLFPGDDSSGGSSSGGSSSGPSPETSVKS